MRNKVLSPYDMYIKIRDKLDTSIPYARDRVKQLEKHMDSEIYIDALSSQGFRNQQVKTKSDNLSEYMGSLTSHLDKLADYILYCKYDDEDNEAEIKELDAQIKIADSNNKARREKLRQEKSDIKPQGRLNLSRRGNYQEIHAGTPSELDNKYGNAVESEPRVIYSFKDKELNQKGQFKNSERYWQHYCQTGQDTQSMFLKTDAQPYPELAYEVLKSLQDEIRRLEAVLEVTDENSETYKIIKNRDLKTLKSNYNISAEVLRQPTVLSMSMILNPSPLDAMYQEIDYQDTKVMKALLLNRFMIKQEGNKKINSMMWVLSQDIDDKIKRVRTRLTPIQNMILSEIIRDKSYTNSQLEASLWDNYNITINKWTLTRQINKIVERLVELDDDRYVLLKQSQGELRKHE